jgi:hypothetical protein
LTVVIKPLIEMKQSSHTSWFRPQHSFDYRFVCNSTGSNAADNFVYKTEVVGRPANLSCAMTRTDKWTRCKWTKTENSREEIPIFDGTMMNTRYSGRMEVSVADDACHLIISSVHRNDDGTFRCDLVHDSDRISSFAVRLSVIG